MTDQATNLAAFLLGDGAYLSASDLCSRARIQFASISHEEWMRGFSIAGELAIVDKLAHDEGAIDFHRVPECRKADGLCFFDE
jgi:hypothetical protein